MRLRQVACKYYWMPIIALAVLGSCWLSIRAWYFLHTPRLIDMFWNSTLHMWEPVYYPELPEYVNVIMFVPVVFVTWWESPVYFQVPYVLSLFYSMLLLWGYRPCIDVA